MGLKNKIVKAIRFAKRFDVLKTLYWRTKLGLNRAASFHVCPRSIVDIDKTAMVNIASGELTINDSWFSTRKRRYVSEFRLDKNSAFVCEGDFKGHLFMWLQEPGWFCMADGPFSIPIRR